MGAFIAGVLADETISATRVVLVGGLLILGIFVAGGVLIPWLRRRFHPSGQGSPGRADAGFSLEGLEAMRRRGEISEGEFRRLRRVALGLDPAAGRTDNSASSHPSDGDDDVHAAPPGDPRPDGEADKESR